ncbi:hypothetical protein GCM10010277_57110 [Streptomyces longisporoflavus]|uniref:hypothetical protein n=1 Tax=Streptomyces longisporoflavus TaxID=28044 RepID=UPI00167E4BCE|nr:hypothetical protein [Streptomyces longisporoflavus]GGV56150.1 hypothetical protein GCM10010277_57110 [Streptomyces longisporoflavus]
MSTAQHLAAIDLLRSREFPAEHGRSAGGDGGPGYRIAELLTSDGFWEDDGTQWEATADQYEAERDGLSVLLADRWGEPQIFSLGGLFERTLSGGEDGTGEDIPEPWGSLSSSVPDLHLWRADGRWIALGVSQWDRELPFQLLAVVTEIDPP